MNARSPRQITFPRKVMSSNETQSLLARMLDQDLSISEGHEKSCTALLARYGGIAEISETSCYRSHHLACLVSGYVNQFTQELKTIPSDHGERKITSFRDPATFRIRISCHVKHSSTVIKVR